MKSKPYWINTNRLGQALEPIEPVFWPLVPIGCEIATGVGCLDNVICPY
jgi:hypothetical protein